MLLAVIISYKCFFSRSQLRHLHIRREGCLVHGWLLLVAQLQGSVGTCQTTFTEATLKQTCCYGQRNFLCAIRNVCVFVCVCVRRIFGSKRDEVTREWRKLQNEEHNDLYSSPNIVRVIKSRIMRWAGHVARMGERRGVYRILVGKPEGKRPLGRPRRR